MARWNLHLLLVTAFALAIPACKRTERAEAPAAPALPAQVAPTPGAAAPAAPAPAPAPQAAAEAEKRIAAAQAVVAQDPRNLQAWISLGNDYFDSQQPQRAIAAYDHALELKPDQPDVLTDQGIMYRELGLFEKAIANFKKANAIDPRHLQSLFNIGIVEANDLHRPERAIEAWRRVAAVAPGTPAAEQAEQAIAELQRRPAPPPAPAPAPNPAPAASPAR